MYAAKSEPGHFTSLSFSLILCISLYSMIIIIFYLRHNNNNNNNNACEINNLYVYYDGEHARGEWEKEKSQTK